MAGYSGVGEPRSSVVGVGVPTTATVDVISSERSKVDCTINLKSSMFTG